MLRVEQIDLVVMNLCRISSRTLVTQSVCLSVCLGRACTVITRCTLVANLVVVIIVIKQMPAVHWLRDISSLQRDVCAVDRRADAHQMAAVDGGSLPRYHPIPQLNTCRRRAASHRVLLQTTGHSGIRAKSCTDNRCPKKLHQHTLSVFFRKKCWTRKCIERTLGIYSLCRCIFDYHSCFNPLKGRGVNWLHFAIQV